MTVIDELLEISNRRMLINGELVDGNEKMSTTNPSDGSDLGIVPQASTEQVDDAVQGSVRGFHSWRTISIEGRQEILRGISRTLRENVNELAMLDAVNGGIILPYARDEIKRAIDTFDYLVALGYEWRGTTIPSDSGSITMTVREPYGPTVRIVAFNHPMMFSIARMAAPLITGNSLLLKLPDQAPLSGLYMAKIIAGLVPPGLVNVLSGAGAITGDAMVSHPDIAHVAFIGSVATGKHILQRCSERVVPATLELGGKNPLIVCEDANIDIAAQAAVSGMNYRHASQSCSSFSRVLVHRSLHDKLAERIAELTSGLSVGSAFDESAAVGPLINSGARDRIRLSVEEAIDAGGRVVAGGHVPHVLACPDGFYFEPTVIVDLEPTHRVAKEELFGPVQVILPWTDPGEAIDIANDVPYGLVSGVQTRDLDLALRFSQGIDAGTVAINGDGRTHWPGVPFGGVKESGLGKEEDLSELFESTRQKTIHLTGHHSSLAI